MFWRDHHRNRDVVRKCDKVFLANPPQLHFERLAKSQRCPTSDYKYDVVVLLKHNKHKADFALRAIPLELQSQLRESLFYGLGKTD